VPGLTGLPSGGFGGEFQRLVSCSKQTGLTMNKWLVSVSIAFAFTVTGVQAAGDASSGQTKSATCVACHGPDGNSPNPIWPKLAGQHPEYILKQLGEFKAGVRKNDLMSPMAAPLSEQDMQDLAAYFSSQTPGKSVEPGFGNSISNSGGNCTTIPLIGCQ